MVYISTNLIYVSNNYLSFRVKGTGFKELEFEQNFNMLTCMFNQEES